MLQSFLLDWNSGQSSPKRQFDLYRDRIWEVFTQVELSPQRDSRFQAKVVHEERQGASLTTVLSTAHLVHRTPACIAQSRNADFYLLYQTTGYTLSQQFRCARRLRPGQIAFYDYTEPFTIDMRASGINGTQVLYFKRTPLLDANRERLFDFERSFAGHRLLPLLHQHLALAAGASGSDELAFHCRSAEQITYLMLEEPEAAPASPRHERLWRRLTVELEARLTQSDYALAELAVALELSPRAVQKLFAERGTTFTDYLRARRLALAAKRLGERRSGASIEQIAYGCGFSDLSTFYRNFRARYGVAPGQIN